MIGTAVTFWASLSGGQDGKAAEDLWKALILLMSVIMVVRRVLAKQGFGGALYEEFTYNERGDPLAATFADYLLPAVHETPLPEVMLREDYDTPLNPLGIKGAGESGITAVGAAQAIGIWPASTSLSESAAPRYGTFRQFWHSGSIVLDIG